MKYKEIFDKDIKPFAQKHWNFRKEDINKPTFNKFKGPLEAKDLYHPGTNFMSKFNGVLE